jgi:xanthine/uracil/vitamin C permease (AzgA family)
MASMAQSVRRSWLDGYFRFTQNGTTLWRDTVAGATTFIVMSYIIFVNPSILSFAGVQGLEGTGLPFDGVLASTCLVAGVMTIIMGLVTNRAYAIAPGLGRASAFRRRWGSWSWRGRSSRCWSCSACVRR